MLTKRSALNWKIHKYKITFFVLQPKHLMWEEDTVPDLMNNSWSREEQRIVAAILSHISWISHARAPHISPQKSRALCIVLRKIPFFQWWIRHLENSLKLLCTFIELCYVSYGISALSLIPPLYGSMIQPAVEREEESTNFHSHV